MSEVQVEKLRRVAALLARVFGSQRREVYRKVCVRTHAEVEARYGIDGSILFCGLYVAELGKLKGARG